MSDHSGEFHRRWLAVGARLGIRMEFVDPAVCGIPESFGRILVARDFGDEKGMMLLPWDDDLVDYAVDLEENGFGFSFFEPPGSPADSDLSYVMEAFADWGWCGAAADKPVWLSGS